MEPIFTLVRTVLTVAIILTIAFRIFRILRPFERGLVERFGKYNREASPGLNIVIPGIEKLIIVDMREAVIDVPPQEVITKDNVTITVDAVIYYEPTDPKSLVYNVEDFITAATKLAQTNLRNVVGDLELDAALTSRETINTSLKLILDEATSHLDMISEQQVREAFRNVTAGRTTLVIAHRLSTVRDSDHIVVLNHGRIDEEGTHEFLLKSNGAYSRLVSTQILGTSG